MNKWLELLVGLILLVGIILLAWASSIYGWTLFGKDFNLLHAAWIMLKGAFFWMIAMVGLLLILLGISEIKD